MTSIRSNRKLGWLAGSALAAAACTPSVALAQDAGPAVNNGSLSFSLGFDVVTQYFFRGIEQEDSGFIIQPYVEVGTTLYEGEDAINSIDLAAGTWNSWHSNETGSAGGTNPEWWYESDLYATLSFTMFDVVGLDLGYVGYFYPSGSASDIHELNIGVSFDDSAYTADMIGSALNPYVLFAIEFDDRSGDDNSYAEIGLEPSWEIVQSADYPITLTVPLAVGLSLDDYYTDAAGNDEVFGFFQVGADFSTPLSMVPAEYGEWSAHAGVYVVVKGDAAGQFDGNDDAEIWGSFGVGMSY